MLGGTEGSILDTYGGEYEWDGNTVKLWQHRGEATQFSIRYGVNMTDYKDETDASECYSAIVPYYVKEDNNEMTIVQGNMVSLGLPTPLGTNYAVVAVDFSDHFQDGVPTMGQLENLARQKLWDDSPVLPNRNIEVKFVRLQDTGEYDEYEDLLKCRLCDTVKVEFPQYKTAARFKIVKTVFDVLQERYTEMELGTLSTTLAEALGISQFGSDNSGGSSGGVVGGLRQITTSGTTSVSGALQIPTAYQSKPLLGLYISGSASLVYRRDTQYLTVMQQDSSYGLIPRANTTVSITAWTTG
jgi:phage-related protein